MTPTANPPDSPRSRRPLTGLSLVTLAGMMLAAIAIALNSGCSRPPKPIADPEGSGVKGEPWQVAAVKLKKQTDLNSTKSALAGLTADASEKEEQKLPALSDEGFAALAALVPLTPADRDEIRGASFTGHDPVYLADCFYLRDAARALALDGLSPEKKADLAFAWVCRQ